MSAQIEKLDKTEKINTKIQENENKTEKKEEIISHACNCGH